MKTLYFECNMGAAGDMLTAALLELTDDPENAIAIINQAEIPGVVVTAENSVKNGITGTHVHVKFNGQEEPPEHDHHGHTHKHTYEHPHAYTHSTGSHAVNGLHDIRELIGNLSVSAGVKKHALEIYELIAAAESDAHGVPVSEIHFHELGMMDAIADIVGVCVLIEMLAPGKILASPINTGSGFVKTAHGILPVPAPAAAYILRGVPVFSDDTKGELCTPTGAAILKHFVSGFCAMPVISVSRIGYGMGTKDFDKANCVRAFFGETTNAEESVCELICNLDDMTSEAVAFAQEVLLSAGALDVYTTPIVMKKSRPAFSLTCMCSLEDKDKMLSLLFRHTSTLGIREYTARRHTLHRETNEIHTKYGTVRVKTATGFGARKSKPEYEDISRIALETGKSISELLTELGL